MRSEIKTKVIKIIYSLYEWVETMNITEDTTIFELSIEMEIELLSFHIEQEFDLPYISPDDISKWIKVKDIVDFVQDSLKCALHGMEI